MSGTALTSSLHARTPFVTVTGSTGTPARTLAFLRHPDEAGTPARILTTRTLADPLTRTVRAFGARWLDNAATGSADAVTATALAGQPLMLHTADGDITLTLSDAAGRPLWSRNAQGTVSRVDYEPADGAGRPLSLTEQPTGGSPRRREQYAYAAFGDAALTARNLAGGLTEHRHNAGISRPLSLGVTGQVLLSDERLLTPEADLPDWSVLTADDTEDSLMVSGTGDATGAPLAQTNAAG
ncbi:hypothetical protein KWH81_23200, partial [Enterobacter cloacae]|nr:hypothetical protein [Enterobacter cloacae]